MNKQKAVAAAIAGTMALAAFSPAVATAAPTPQTPYYQDRHHDDRWERRQDRREMRQDRREYRQYQRDLQAERRWREQQWRYDRQNRDNGTRNAVFAFVAGAVIGSIITDNRGERRQYYRDPSSGRYYYYNYDRRSYNWDYNYRPGMYR